MAFKARFEYWALSDTVDGVATVVLEHAVADAIEPAAGAGPLALPEQTNKAAYALSVTGLSGTCVVQIGPLPNDDPQVRGRRVATDTTHWFVVQPGDLYTIAEYVAL